MGRFKHAMRISDSFKNVLSASLRSSFGTCFGSKPAIVGFSPTNPENNRLRRVIQVDEQKPMHNKENINNDGRAQLSNRQGSDPTVDPVETVSLAFDFLKEETGSMFTENEGNIEHVSSQHTNKQPIYRFRPPQISAITKKIFSRNNNYDFTTNGISESTSSSHNDLDTIQYKPNPTRTHQQQQQHHHHRIQKGQRTHSETHLYHEQEPVMHFSPHYGSRLVNGSRAPISTNPLWTRPSPTSAGSQPNLLSPSLADSSPFYYQSSSRTNFTQSNLYGSYPDNKSDLILKQQKQSNKRQMTKSQYLDTNEFILRASNGQPLRNQHQLNRNISRDYRPHSVNVNGTSLDVYY